MISMNVSSMSNMSIVSAYPDRHRDERFSLATKIQAVNTNGSHDGEDANPNQHQEKYNCNTFQHRSASLDY